MRNANIGHGNLRWDDVATISKEKAQEFQRFKLDVDDIVISLDRPIISTGLKVARITKNDLPCLLLQRVGKFEFKTDEIVPEFFFLWLQSPIFINAIDPGRSNGVPHISSKSIEAIPFSLPSKEEQKRIVEKCDRLLSICDEIEKRQQQRQESIVRMNESAIAQLLSSQNPDDFRQHWQRICNNFDLIYSVPETIPKLRQAILQLAVQGKLVRQDPNDESALLVIEKIKHRREYLVKENKIPKLKLYPSINNNELPYILPNSWSWQRIDYLCQHVIDCLHSTPKFLEEGKYCIDTTCIKQGEIIFDKLRFVSEDSFQERIRRLKPQPGDILFSREGTIGLAVILPEGLEVCLGQRMMMFRTFNEIVPEYFRYALVSDTFVQQWQSKLIGTAARHINIADIRKMLIPLPPTAEQKRIVEKCDSLMSLCDTLEAKLKQGRDSSEKLMEVAAKQVLTA
ncbi:hypothetical protein B6N60_02343 [Richelia sinica FACHB-800]|uniref:Type I restriction modification DNA specificity domain-containing protein n=1 Tax=Richelia sinica FACHB-800 TaxID=1357546 RepID=A0A975Y4Y2_9NOST|nr:restriction endonuclease subunit S [Richelia sinica]MBD2667314.1 restriction endonuclease subunit S [Richelia sinica FACHB-800]QXE23653.1 hypothetical protein B6N60_02343 [Richelia sinica FACHB-800]